MLYIDCVVCIGCVVSNEFVCLCCSSSAWESRLFIVVRRLDVMLCIFNCVLSVSSIVIVVVVAALQFALSSRSNLDSSKYKERTAVQGQERTHTCGQSHATHACMRTCTHVRGTPRQNEQNQTKQTKGAEKTKQTRSRRQNKQNKTKQTRKIRQNKQSCLFCLLSLVCFVFFCLFDLLVAPG